MNAADSYDRQDAAYRRLRPSIDQNHAPGTFIAIADEQIIASAADFRALEALLRARGIELRDTLVAQAGDNMPDSVTIFI